MAVMFTEGCPSGKVHIVNERKNLERDRRFAKFVYPAVMGTSIFFGSLSGSEAVGETIKMYEYGYSATDGLYAGVMAASSVVIASLCISLLRDVRSYVNDLNRRLR
ncbi:MAG: hypothetical protein HYW25_04300 [Candidatus Aenigmarchaeota archaeon]|nr:hypothetical protein [Candidatus Aenigmarchaeota archaeon]